MNIATLQLKKNILKKLDAINDTEYLASLDAVLTYETFSANDDLENSEEKAKLKQSRWQSNSPMVRALNWLNRK